MGFVNGMEPIRRVAGLTGNNLSNITPFTQRDGYTYLQYLEALKERISDLIESEIQRNQAIIDWTKELSDSYTAFTKAVSDKIDEALATLIGYTVNVDGDFYRVFLTNGDEFEAYTVDGANKMVSAGDTATLNAANQHSDDAVSTLTADILERLTLLRDELAQAIIDGDSAVEGTLNSFIQTTRTEIVNLLTGEIATLSTTFNAGLATVTGKVAAEKNRNDDQDAAIATGANSLSTLRGEFESVEDWLNRVSRWRYSEGEKNLTNDTKYNAFPGVCNSNGVLVAGYSKAIDHHNGDTCGFIRSLDGGQSWSEYKVIPRTVVPTGDPHSFVAIAAYGNTVKLMTMVGGPYRTFIFTSNNQGQTFTYQNEVTYPSGVNKFPNQLYYDTDGTLYLTCYAGSTGIQILKSTNGGTSFTLVSTLTTDSAYSEACIGKVGDYWVCLARYEGTANYIQPFKSTDGMKTWSIFGTRINSVIGNPRFTVMSDGSCVLVSRIKDKYAAGDTTAYCTSKDGGKWRVEPLSTAYNMYAQPVEIGSGKGLVLASAQTRGVTTLARIFTQELTYTTNGDVESDTGWIALTEFDFANSTDAAVRIKDGVMYLQGALTLEFTADATERTLFRLPFDLAPRSTVVCIASVPSSDSKGVWVRIYGDGRFTVNQYGTATKTLFLGCVPPFVVR